MLHREQDPQDMEAIKDYRHTEAREDSALPKNYRPISLLCHTYKLYERLILNRVSPLLEQHLIKEQAGFRPGKSCTSQLLNLTQHIEDGYQRGMITGAAFVDLSAAYDTVNHRILIQKLYNTTQDSQLCRVFQNMLSNRGFYVELNNERSRWRKQKNGLPQGSVLSPILFNIYTNDQPIHDGTRNFIYADDICVTAQYSSFTEVETTIGDALDELTHYYRSNSLRANPDKTQVIAFNLRNKEANRSLKVEWNRTKLENTPHPKYLGVTLGSHAKLQGAHAQHKDGGGHPQQSTKKGVQFEMGSKRKYHKNNSIGIMLFCG